MVREVTGCRDNGGRLSAGIRGRAARRPGRHVCVTIHRHAGGSMLPYLRMAASCGIHLNHSINHLHHRNNSHIISNAKGVEILMEFRAKAALSRQDGGVEPRRYGMEQKRIQFPMPVSMDSAQVWHQPNQHGSGGKLEPFEVLRTDPLAQRNFGQEGSRGRSFTRYPEGESTLGIWCMVTSPKSRYSRKKNDFRHRLICWPSVQRSEIA